jgi:protein tyrosine phosphatase
VEFNVKINYTDKINLKIKIIYANKENLLKIPFSPPHQTLLSLKPPKCFRANVANAVYNANKNAKLSVVPWDFNRVELPREPGADGSDYINASWIDGYR